MKNISKPPKYADDAPLTAREIRTARPARVAVPEIVAAYKAGKLRARGRPVGSSKTHISLRIDNEVLAFFRAQGPRWQTRIDKVLKDFVGKAR